MNFRIGHVLEELKNGELRKHVLLTGSTGAYALSFGSANLVVERGGVSLSEAERKQIEEQEKELAYQKICRKATARVVSVFRDENALRVQRLLQGDLTSQTMWHIAELIKADIGGAIKDLISKNQLTRFERSINHPVVFGEHARHIVSKEEPPPTPMSLDEARKFIRDLATGYLEKKAGLPPLT